MRPISVNDDLAPDDASIADGPADDKTSRPIHRHAIRWQLAKERNNGVFGESFFDAPLDCFLSGGDRRADSEFGNLGAASSSAKCCADA